MQIYDAIGSEGCGFIEQSASCTPLVAIPGNPERGLPPFDPEAFDHCIAVERKLSGVIHAHRILLDRLRGRTGGYTRECTGSERHTERLHASEFTPGELAPPCGIARKILQPRRLKNCTARSCFSACSRVLNVPRLRRLPVFGF